MKTMWILESEWMGGTIYWGPDAERRFVLDANSAVGFADERSAVAFLGMGMITGIWKVREHGFPAASAQTGTLKDALAVIEKQKGDYSRLLAVACKTPAEVEQIRQVLVDWKFIEPTGAANAQARELGSKDRLWRKAVVERSAALAKLKTAEEALEYYGDREEWFDYKAVGTHEGIPHAVDSHFDGDLGAKAREALKSIRADAGPAESGESCGTI